MVVNNSTRVRELDLKTVAKDRIKARTAVYDWLKKRNTTAVALKYISEQGLQDLVKDPDVLADIFKKSSLNPPEFHFNPGYTARIIP